MAWPLKVAVPLAGRSAAFGITPATHGARWKRAGTACGPLDGLPEKFEISPIHQPQRRKSHWQNAEMPSALGDSGTAFEVTMNTRVKFEVTVVVVAGLVLKLVTLTLLGVLVESRAANTK